MVGLTGTDITRAEPVDPSRMAFPARLPEMERRTLVMGVLNVTPDSFSDGGRYEDVASAIDRGLALRRDGADILDVGGESTRPGHVPIPAEEEQRRVLPVIAALAGRLDIPISIDTYKAATAEVSLKAGARIVNDVWGLQREPDIAAVAAAYDAPVVVMHNRERADPSLAIFDELRRYFDRSLAIARLAGVPDRNVILDPGIGFGKTIDQQLEVLRRLRDLRAFGFPLLVGISRKSLLGRIAARDIAPADRLFSSLAAHVLSATLGADIVRVHDVREHVEAMRVVDVVMRR